ncbi:uncharacterized protein LOC114186577 [Vigna unguiculata]|uniref:uncharacterized protein LOC114186577 n=1 Tax=Vigna unguiculata TaxID=3917 RepID=UPI0010170A9B|nr:uncharacterized protein LOC114186577 [Vigna unguiculata]
MDAVTSRNVIFYSLLQEIHASGNEISVTVTANASAVRDWLTAALYSSRYYVHLKRLVVGLSVHWTLSGANLNTPVHTLQLLIGRRILIFQLAHATTVPNKLRTFLLNPSHTFVGLSNFWDPQKLLCSRHRLRMARAPVDLVLYVNSLLRGRLPKEIVIERCLG